MIQDRAILQWLIKRKSYMIYRTAPFSMTPNDSQSRFRYLTLNISETVRNTGIVTTDY